MNFILRLLFGLIQWIWGLPQNLAGFLLLLCLGKQQREHYHGALITRFSGKPWLARQGCLSLGMFVFIGEHVKPEVYQQIRVHEYGHTVQSLLFGPLFLVIVGIPSVLWASRYNRHGARYRAQGIAYTSRFPENHANYCGARLTGEQPMNW